MNRQALVQEVQEMTHMSLAVSPRVIDGKSS